ASDGGPPAPIRFSGYDMYFEDGTPATLMFASFCDYGTKALFGRGMMPDSQLVDMYFVPVADLWAAKTRVPKPLKARRLFAQREGDQVAFHFLNGVKTEMQFDLQRDDRRVLEWIGGANLADGETQWFDFIAIPVASDERLAA